MFLSILVLLTVQATDTLKQVVVPERIVYGQRVDATVPVTYTEVSRIELRRVNLGRDIPALLLSSPSVVSTSDAGMGVGYTGLRIRGTDDTRINVTINGIPLNDAESHGVFWVNLPDFASSVGSMQIQRGVGSSVNGPAAFGASVNIETHAAATAPSGELTTGYGSFNTGRTTLTLGTGLLPSKWAIDGRLSRITSDGFIDRATSDLESGMLTISRTGARDVFSVNLMSGAERTYQAWNGVPEARLRGDVAGMNHYADQHWLSDAERAHLLASGNRTYNAYTYDDQVDRYRQTHLQAHYRRLIGDAWSTHVGLHYTLGSGYYEEFRVAQDPADYGFAPGDASDLIRRRWLDNDFYGIVASAERRSGRSTLTLGGALNRYDGDHFGEVIWARDIPDAEIRSRYYDNTGVKTDASAFAKWNVELGAETNLFADLQVRHVDYSFLGFDTDLNNVTQTDDMLFLNPKLGVVRRLGERHRWYASFAVGNKEPTRRDYTQSTADERPKHETLYDLELGYRFASPSLTAGVNLYRMSYDNQLVLTGAVNDVGAYIRENVKESVRQGIELEAATVLFTNLFVDGNLTLSRSVLPEFVEYLDNYDDGGQTAFRYTDTDISFSPRVIGALNLRWEAGKVSIGTQMKHVSRQYLDNAMSVSRSLDPYSTVDLILGASATEKIRLQAIVYNLLDAEYESNGYTYGWIGGGEQRFNFYYPQAGRHVMMQVTIGF
jgi:iron complex outermembrane receptor protein